MTHDPDTSLLGRTPGLAEEHFAHDGLITKHAVRAVALAALRPMPGQLLWDLGTGAGSIAPNGAARPAKYPRQKPRSPACSNSARASAAKYVMAWIGS